MTSSAGQLLVVGFSPAMARALQAFRPDGSVVFLDEPSVATSRKAGEFLAGIPSCSELVEWEYQRPDAADELFLSGRLPARLSGVVPGIEYATVFAARLAERLELPSAGLGAALVMRDKSRLRRVSAAAGVPNPLSRPVESGSAVARLMAEVGGPVIVKPAGRQAAVGVSKVVAEGDADAAYRFAAAGEEGGYVPDRGVRSEVLAEEFVAGAEFSVELIVRAGRALFANVTDKVLFDGDRPIERGHLLPSDARPELTAELIALTERVVAAVGFDTGFVHCEWIDSVRGPYLVECAGRVPGDGITVLLGLAWGRDLVELYVRLLEGWLDPADVPTQPAQYAAVSYAATDPGTVAEVRGVDSAASMHGVVSAAALVTAGSVVAGLRSSWDRGAMAIAVGASAQAAKSNAEAALAAIEVTLVMPQSQPDEAHFIAEAL